MYLKSKILMKPGMMNRQMLPAFFLSVAVLSGCGKEGPKVVDNYPRTPGETVVFGASIPSGGATRTEYSGETYQDGSAKIEKINWLSGDEIVIYGENVDPSSTNPARYGITPKTDKTKASLSLLSVTGLRWGTSNADFYGVYPSPEKFNALHSDLGPMAVNGDGTAFTVVSGISSEQSQTLASGTVYKPDMTLAPMLAVQKNVSTSDTDPVDLTFYPLMTAFEVKLTNMSESGPISIKRVSLIKEGGVLWQKRFTYSFPKSGFLDSHADLYTRVTATDLATSAGTHAGNTVYADFGTAGVSVPKDAVLDLTLFTTPQNHSGLTLQVFFADGTTKKLKLNKKSDGTPVNFRKFRKHVVPAKIDPVTFDLNLNLTPQEWSSWEESLEYTDHVSVMSGGKIAWTAGSYSQLDGTDVFMKFNTVAECSFTLETPEDGTWFASLETVGGEYDAFVFVDGSGNQVSRPSGAVGTQATLRIKTSHPYATGLANKAVLHVTVLTKDGRTIRVRTLVDDSGSEYTLVQDI